MSCVIYSAAPLFKERTGDACRGKQPLRKARVEKRIDLNTLLKYTMNVILYLAYVLKQMADSLYI